MATLLDFSKPHLLRDATEYTAAVAEIDRLLDADPRPQSEEYERLEFLSVFVQTYEDAHWPLAALSTPQDVVTFMLEQQGRSHDDLAQWLGGQAQMSEFLQGARPLSLTQITTLREHLGLPADLLIDHDEGRRDVLVK